jgi:hypothetical protein
MISTAVAAGSRGGGGPQATGTDVGRITVRENVSHIRDITGILCPNGVGSDKRECARKIMLATESTSKSSCFLEPRLELLSSVIGEGMGEGRGN